MLHVARLALVTFVVASGSWAFVAPHPAAAAAGARPQAALAESASRSAPAPRSLRTAPVAPAAPDREVTELVPAPYRVRYTSDPALFVGQERVLIPGVEGQARQVWLVSYQDGVESSRSLVTSVEITAPADEMRAAGTRPWPAPPAPPAIDRVIRVAAAQYGADPEQLLRVAWCESRFDPGAYNSRFGDSGLFQFIPTTWAANAPRVGYAGASVFDAEANASVAAWMFRRGQAWQWTCK